MQRVSLADGRTLFAAAYGPQSGRPLLYCHGTPSAHNEWEVFGNEQLLERFGLRLIVPDRPGLGLSSFQRNRRLSDWPADAASVMDAFGVTRFGVLGYSGGGAYATATALALAARIERLVLVAPVIHASPEMEEGLDAQALSLKQMARDKPFLASLILGLAMGLPARFSPSSLKPQMLKTLPPPDVEAMLEGGRIDRFLLVLREAFRQGSKGPTRDMGLLVTPWDIELGKAPFPVDIWQGELDNFGARPAMARYLAEQLGASNLHLPQEGHISVFTRNIEAVLGAFAA